MFNLKKYKSFFYRFFPALLNKKLIIDNNNYLREIFFASVFKDSIQDSWIKNKKFSPSGASANYSFLYILFKVLDIIKPKNILELGMGESSRLLFQYSSYNINSKITFVDNDEFWMNLVKNQLKEFNNKNLRYLLLNLTYINFKGFKVKAYKNLLSNLEDENFDLIIIDGPNGSKRFSRIGALDLLSNLSKKFVILVDDCSRQGELELAKKIMETLSFNKIEFDFSVYRGIKTQYIIYSQNFSFLKTL